MGERWFPLIVVTHTRRTKACFRMCLAMALNGSPGASTRMICSRREHGLVQVVRPHGKTCQRSYFLVQLALS